MGERVKLLALFEDHEPTIKSLEKMLAYEGYRIVVKARNMQQSLEVATQLSQLEVLAALVDGNLTEGNKGNWEGAQITEVIHRKSSGVVVIGTASGGLVQGADFNVQKTEGPQALFDVLAKIFS